MLPVPKTVRVPDDEETLGRLGWEVRPVPEPEDAILGVIVADALLLAVGGLQPEPLPDQVLLVLHLAGNL